MNIRMIYYKILYKRHGFFWNSQLEQFVREYGGKEIPYAHPDMGFMLWADFRFRTIILGAETPYRKLGYLCSAADDMGEDVALVGKCEQGHIYLLLTESGKFIGVDDEYGLVRWGTADLDWRSSLKNLLEGSPATKIEPIRQP